MKLQLVPGGLPLGRQLQLLALEDLGDVEVEEVAIQNGLDAPGNDGNDVVEA